MVYTTKNADKYNINRKYSCIIAIRWVYALIVLLRKKIDCQMVIYNFTVLQVLKLQFSSGQLY